MFAAPVAVEVEIGDVVAAPALAQILMECRREAGRNLPVTRGGGGAVEGPSSLLLHRTVKGDSRGGVHGE